MVTKSPFPLSVVLPIYNESKSLPTLLSEYKKYSKKYHFELVCVNNGSNDDTNNVLVHYAAKKDFGFISIVSVTKNIGYGHGILTGLKKAQGEVLSWTHADMQTSPTDVFLAYEIYKKYKDQKCVIKGKRYGRPAIDSFISMSMGLIASVILGSFYSEINAQPKLFHRSLLKKMTNPPRDFLLDLYVLWLAKKNRYSIITIPVLFEQRKFGVSKWAYSFSSRIRMVIRTITYMVTLRVHQ